MLQRTNRLGTIVAVSFYVSAMLVFVFRLLGRHIHEPPEMVVQFSVVGAFKWLHNGNGSKWPKTQDLRTGKVNL